MDKVTFFINGKEYSATSSLAADTTLNTYIRDCVGLKGTKFMCQEGGCGCCVVAACIQHPVTKEKTTFAVNSCLVLIFACQGWDITTIEGIGSQSTGYHPIQKKLAQMNGTQCGFCSPGMVMNMYSLTKDSKKLTVTEVENSLAGNICRCTGYRPILDAFKSLADDAPQELKDVQDIEDLRICPKTGRGCSVEWVDAELVMQPRPVTVDAQGARWYKVTTLNAIFDIIQKPESSPYMLVAGNTAHGVYRRPEGIRTFVDVNDVAQLRVHSAKAGVVVGAGVTLREWREILLSVDLPYASAFADHLDLVAHPAVRNIGTIAGNLSLKHEHKDFQSDVFLLLEAVGASVNVLNDPESVVQLLPEMYLEYDMNKKIIESISLPSLNSSFVFRSYKVMRINQNAHAIVNAAFLLEIDDKGVIKSQPRIVYGGISPQFVHASNTEKYLTNKNILSNDIIQAAMKMLTEEVKPVVYPAEPSPEYRKQLAVSLFYKCILSLYPEKVTPKNKSGGQLLTRPTSKGSQDFETDKSVWPLNQPVPKFDGLVQCAGEAQFTNDLPPFIGEVFGAFVLTTVGKGNVKSISADDALKVPGVVAFFSAKDIPGLNSFTEKQLFQMPEDEEVFCSGPIKHAGQPVGVLLAENQQLALSCVKLVKVEYTDVGKPVLHIRDAIKSDETDRVKFRAEMKPSIVSGKGNDTHTIIGSFDNESQYHYHMETQTCIVVPVEGELDVYAASQWLDLTQRVVAKFLKIDETRVNMYTRRLGGGFGGKISRSGQVACAAALGAFKLQRPVRFIMSMEANMEAIGKRVNAASDYEVEVNDDGVIQSLKATIYENNGAYLNESLVELYTLPSFRNVYDYSKWHVDGKAVHTDIPSNTYMRAPGSCEGIAAIENIMEHIAKETDKDPVDVRMSNMGSDDNPMKKIMKKFINDVEYFKRKQEIENFNNQNRWQKKGLSVVPMNFNIEYWTGFHAVVSIFAGDGTVKISHSGIEMGQGLNTKVVQVCAYTLGIDVKQISVKTSSTSDCPNDNMTGASVSSESYCYAVMTACKELLNRLAPIKEKLKEPTWKELITEAFKAEVDLSASAMFKIADAKNYSVYGCAAAEMVFDILTGQHQILRLDVLEDTGRSLSPYIDVGQVEGAMVQGIGYWLHEEILYDEETGKVLTNRSWNYKPPGAKDIPVDFRVQFRKNARNPDGILGSKATGEPPLCMSCVVLFATRNAITSARQDSGNKEMWFPMNAPYTSEKIFLNSLNNIEQYIL